MKERDRAQLVAGVSQCQDSWRLYRSLRNFASQCIKNAKKGWETLQLDSFSNNATDLWRNVKGWMGWKNSGPPTQLFYEGKIVSSPHGLASTMNSFFIKKVEDLQKKLPPAKGNPLENLQQAMSTRTCSFRLEPVHPDEVLDIVTNLRTPKLQV